MKNKLKTSLKIFTIIKYVYMCILCDDDDDDFCKKPIIFHFIWIK